MRLTSREKEIVEVLQKDPLISQDELALHFGISRSSVAVHISNLMKKGIILGKGYVFNKQVSIVVMGQIYLEIYIRDEAGQISIDLRYTGFGPEVCKTLSGYGVNSQLISVIGSDNLGNSMLNDLKTHQIDTTHIYQHPDKRTCRKVVSEQGPYWEEGFGWQDFQHALASREWVISNCDWLITEPQFIELVKSRMSNRKDSNPVLCGCWYTGKNIPSYLLDYNLLVLGTADFNNYEFYINKSLEMLEVGTENCIITDGSSSMVLVNKEGVRDFPLPPNQSFDSGQDLHLFLAGLVYGLSAGYPMRQALRIASGAAHTSRDRDKEQSGY